MVNTSAPSQASSSITADITISAEQAGSAVPDGERKTVTALFADIKGSMELMEGLDPEEARAIVDPALKLMIDAVHRYAGHIVQSTGDGIFALFGAPVAHEDHPQRALYAALRMQDDIGRYGDGMRAKGQAPLRVRVGVNTGEVVVRTLQTGIGQTEYTPIGHSTSLAARLETLATPGSTVISGHTRGFVEGFFQLKGLGPTIIKGVSGPVELFEVTGLGPLRTRLQAAARRGLTKFVGREAELRQMRQALDSAKAGHGQIVAVMGEAGVGKSRLFFEFKAIAQAGCLVLEAYSVSHGRASAYLPVSELLREYFEISSADDERKRRELILGKLLALDRALEDAPPYLYSLMGVAEANHSLAQMDPQIRRRRTHEAIKRILLRESLNQPLIIIFEDLHWIDGETQALLDHLVEAIAHARVLLLVNYRPEYRHEWGSRTHYSQLRLDPLGRESAVEMLSTLLGDEPELEPLKRLIADKTEGNPFFIEEIVQALFEQGALARNGKIELKRPLSVIKVPPTVQAVLASRIDRLPPTEKELLQTLAVVGREFTLPLVRRVAPGSDIELENLLGDLQSGEFIYEQPAFPDPEFSFKHALTQEVAYNSVLMQRRRLLHERVGAAIEEIYAGRLDDHLSELARHYERSGSTRKALEYLGRAGQQAMARSGHSEAAELFMSALELLTTLPETPERIRQELALQLGLGPALNCIKGLTAPEVDAAYTRARELCRQLGETPQLAPVLFGLWLLSVSRAQVQTAREQAHQLLSIAQNQPDADVLLMAHCAMEQTLFFLGEFVPAQTHFERASLLYDPTRNRLLAALYTGVDMGVISLGYAAGTQWLLGYPDQAVDRDEQARARAEELSHPYSLGIALYFSSILHMFRREGEAALKFADENVRLTTDHGFQQLLASAICSRGGALVERGQAEEGITQLREGHAALDALGAGAGQTMRLGWQAAGYGGLGRVEEGLAAVAEALATSERTGECFFEAELFRLRGDLLLERDAQAAQSKVESEAELCFRQALEIARRQQAKSWELRAATSLSRLLARQHRHDEARALLLEIYNWFTEGFDTADLKDAKALIDELSA
jgi:class 3 adenylate cyclase/predicted ATPase